MFQKYFYQNFYCDKFRLIDNTSSWTTYIRRLKILFPQGLDIFQFESKISLSHCLLCLLSFTNSFAAFALDVVSQVYVFVQFNPKKMNISSMQQLESIFREFVKYFPTIQLDKTQFQLFACYRIILCQSQVVFI